MAPFLRGLIRRFLASRISNPSPPPSNQTASYTYLQALDGIATPKLQERRDAESSEKYNLESIPGLWLCNLGIFSEEVLRGGNRLSELLFRLGYRISLLVFNHFNMPTTSSIFREPNPILIIHRWLLIFYWIVHEVVLDVQVDCNLYILFYRTLLSAWLFSLGINAFGLL